MYSRKFISPVGELTLVASDKGIAAILWKNQKHAYKTQKEYHPHLLECEKQLREYFSGKRTEFSLPLDPAGTEFQKKVWKNLAKIPFGKTKSYSELARALGNPNASRAVGAANGKNPIAIVVPCHRVIGANGKLTGFAGGLDAKKALLTLEAPAL